MVIAIFLFGGSPLGKSFVVTSLQYFSIVSISLVCSFWLLLLPRSCSTRTRNALQPRVLASLSSYSPVIMCSSIESSLSLHYASRVMKLSVIQSLTLLGFQSSFGLFSDGHDLRRKISYAIQFTMYGRTVVVGSPVCMNRSLVHCCIATSVPSQITAFKVVFSSKLQSIRELLCGYNFFTSTINQTFTTKFNGCIFGNLSFVNYVGVSEMLVQQSKHEREKMNKKLSKLQNLETQTSAFTIFKNGIFWQRKAQIIAIHKN